MGRGKIGFIFPAKNKIRFWGEMSREIGKISVGVKYFNDMEI
jgi:hypothetical protein